MVKKIVDALNQQVNAEYWSAYLYLSMSLDAEAKGYKGTANWMFCQWLEEQEHARVLQKFIMAIGGNVELKSIAAVPLKWKGIHEMFREALQQEKKVTEKIYSIVSLAAKENDYATVSHLQWFVNEQVEEEQTVDEILQSLDIIGDDKAAVYEFDQTLRERRTENCA